MKLHYDFKKTVIAFSAAILLGTGVAGGVDVPGLSLTIAAASGAQVASQTDQKTQKELQALVAGVKEGTLLAYYVRDEVSNPQDAISFSGKGFVFKDYKSFAAKFKALRGPSIPQPGNLPKGFTLARAIIYPPAVANDSELYLQLEQELKAAAVAGNSNKQLFSKIISWNQTNLSMQLYAKGKANFSIVTGSPPAKLPEGAVPFVRASESKKELTVNGRKVVLTTDSAKDASFNTKLVWLDNSGTIQYTLSDNRASTLTTNEMLAVAKTMIK
ncbi:hypothetical protein BSK49_14105 [Paenibacillus odorifer]|uniref:hypothetical protein n=1 Tax=Paenibacillus odorifer TaxID=189426 RepID=UPI00096FC98F|nr:hypothetical protein [Paenibacillus odorifer]OMD57799.1 hypothetical protein BSK55_16245 [Paenibacillus odorifer]OMD89025.1 hypothetical protein BSK49_14105 [Paenibacillus odorifer]